MNEQYKLLKQKLDNFITRYSIYKLLYSIILFIIIISVIFSLAILLEHFYFIKNYLRGIIFYFILTITVYLSIELLIIPVVLIFRKRKYKDYYNAAKIIESNYTNIQDKLINVIELVKESDSQSNYSINLVNASIKQKSLELRKFKIKETISVKRIIRRISIIVILFSIVGIGYTKNDKIIKASTTHYINYNKVLSKIERKVKVNILNNNLNVEEGSDFKLEILIKTKEIIKEPIIKYFGNKFYLHQDSTNYYSYIFNSINNSFSFNISVNNYTSKTYSINVIKIPVIEKFSINIIPPKYTGISPSVLNNIGDFSVAEGSYIKWIFNVVNTDTLYMFFKKMQKKVNISIIKHKGIYNASFIKNENYTVSLINREINKEYNLNYSIEIIKDKYPTIEVNEIKDTNNFYGRMFYGFIQDDYGLDSLFFTIVHLADNNIKRIALPLISHQNQVFYFQYDFNEIDDDAVVEYYFEVWDNDRINGSKRTISNIETITKLNNKEKEKISDAKFKSIENNIKSAISLSNEISNDLEKIKENLISDNMSNFEKDRVIKNLVQKKKDLEDIIDKIKKEYKEKSIIDKLDVKEKEELKKKQKEISELLDNLLTDEIKKLIEELQKLQNEQGKENDIKNTAEKIDFNIKDISKQIDNTLELLKKMEVERKIKKSIDDLNELAQKLQKDNFNSNSEISKERKEEFNSIMEEYEKTKDLNKELKNKLPLIDFVEDSNKITNKFDETLKSLQQNKKKKASKQNTDNSLQIKALSDKMKEMFNKMQAKENQIDIELLNSIIDNITQFSFKQEDIMVYGKNISINNPLYSKTYIDQQNVAKEYKFIEKQLDTLTERTTAINYIIKKDVNNIEQNLVETNNYFENKQKSKIAVKQQFIMTSANNLLLKLDEVLKSLMENSQAGNSENNKNCKKPSKPSPGISDLKKQQESFKNQLQDMIKQMKESKNGKPKNSNLAKMLAEQEMYQELLNELSNKNKIGDNTSKILHDIKKLVEENISDIIRAKIDDNLLKRQDLIKTRLLKAEQSEREREVEKQRIAQENLVDKKSNPSSNFEYNKENYNFNELLKKKNVNFNEFYRKKTNRYLKFISE